MASLKEKIIARIESLERLPANYETLLELRQTIARQGEQAVSATDLVGIIEKDINLSAKLLRITNSTLYAGRFGRIGDITQAIARLGVLQVIDIATALASMANFKSAQVQFDMKMFWRHSVGVGLVTRAFAQRSTHPATTDGSSYIAGLFHDFGILIMAIYFEPMLQKIQEIALQDQRHIHAVEREILEIDHGEIGGLVLSHWKFPEHIIEAVSWHHEPERAKPESLRLTQMVHLADFGCSTCGITAPGEILPTRASDAAWSDLGIDADDILQLVTATEEELGRSKTFVEVGI